MDVQNAVDTDPTRPAGSSPKPQEESQQQQQHHQPQLEPRQQTGSATDRQNQSIAVAKEPSPLKDTPAATHVPSTAAVDDGSIDDRDSDAETIVLPGKDGHSPSKVRKVRQEDKSESDGDAARAAGAARQPSRNNDEKLVAVSRPDDGIAKKKRLSGSIDKDRQAARRKDISSGLSSAPTSPPHHYNNPHHRRRRSDDARSSPSDSEHSQHRSSSKVTIRDKIRAGERLLPHKRKAPKAESDDDTENRHVRRQRTTSTGFDSGRPPKDSKSAYKTQFDSRNRSVSPPPRHHRRSASTQLPSQSNGLSQKKKRLPPPLQPTDYHSDESSASGSPHPRASKLRSLATPALVDATNSPVKAHRKHLDAHGQTLLARACARGEYEVAKQRLKERPEDLNVADYAGNTPLQIAAINGCEDIVKLLIDAGCNLDCVNYDKDTPLLDAVDNGHLGVVKLLLDAGVNPRKANVNGEEPIDRVSEDTENAEEIRTALQEAKKRAGERRRTSEDRHSHNDNAEMHDSHAPDSPRQSPAAAGSGASGKRGGTIRSTKTRNDLLYMPLDDKTLRQAAGRGDEETVARILQVKEGYDDPESMVAAARGGHDLVIELLLGLGGANPDPGPVLSLQAEFATPILAAIGQENIKVVELLLRQQSFDPTRRFKGETYYEIARRRQGTNWKEEEHMLKNAYDEYKRSHKDSIKTKSPARRDRDREREEKRARRDEGKDESHPAKRIASSPMRDNEPRKKANASRLTSPRDAKRADSLTNHSDEHSQKRGPGRPKKDDKVPSINISDREVSPTLSHKTLKSKRAESDLAGASSEGEAVKPRKRLVSKGELRGERDKQRRASMASNASSLKEPPSPRDSRSEDPSDKHKLSEKYHDRTKALKRDDSRDRLSISGDGSGKRHRSSVTPDRPSNGDKDDEVPVKRRRLDAEGQERRLNKRPTSADERPKQALPREGSTKASLKGIHKDREDDQKEGQDSRGTHRKESGKSAPIEKSIHVKSEDVDVEMQDVVPAKELDNTESAAAATAAREAEDELARKRKKKRLAEEEEAKKEEERKRLEAEEKKRKRDHEEAQKREEEEKRRKEAERELKKKKQEEEAAAAAAAAEAAAAVAAEEQRLQEQAERERREAEEAARRRAEEEKRRLEEEARKEEERKREEERRKEEERRQEEERRKEEEERKRREDEERLRKEQLEREAAEEARRLREEEERKERERRERAHREEMERKRAAREAEQRRIREEQEKARLDKLPPLLRWLDTSSNAQTSTVADKLSNLQGVRYDTIRPGMDGTAEGREQWVLNVDVALLLGEKDLDLSRYTAWDRLPVSQLAKLTILRAQWPRYSLLSETLHDLGRQLGTYYGDEDPASLSFDTRKRLKQETWDRFLDMEMFFVKVSDFMYTVPNIPHLKNVKLSVEYRELPENENKLLPPGKWKQDPDANRYHGFAPGRKYFLNGELVGEELPRAAQTSKTPFPEKRVPRRGLLQVYPDDPDYTRLCTEQGLEHLLKDVPSSLRPNGIHSPTSTYRPLLLASSVTNGPNGHSLTQVAEPEPASKGKDLTNGINGA